MKRFSIVLAILALGVSASFAQDADATSRERARILIDTNATTTVLGYSATAAGQLLSGKVGGTNAVWMATTSGSNAWVKVAQ